jgi:BirA family biotin operon repressor/biotin-[acetyl-CoA-carboxylase] ligase
VDEIAPRAHPPAASGLDAAALRAAGVPTGFDVRVVDVTGSTNADLAAEARRGAAAGRVLVAQRQTAGRGRLDRSWASPAGTGLTFSVLLRPPVEPGGPGGARLGWLPLLAGVALVTALAEVPGLAGRLALKWPNDLLVDGRKAAGILAEAVPAPGGPPAVVLGIGLNVTTPAADLPPGATSLTLAAPGETPGRAALLAAVLRHLERDYTGWLADPSLLPPAYRRVCATLGRQVRVELPSGPPVVGTAVDVDPAGRLVVGAVAFSAGDVVHLRAPG